MKHHQTALVPASELTVTGSFMIAWRNGTVQIAGGYGKVHFLSNCGAAMAEFDQEIDVCGLNCPLPILRAKKSLAKMVSGQVLHIIATDPGALKDFDAFARQTGNELLKSAEENGKFYFLLKKI